MLRTESILILSHKEEKTTLKPPELKPGQAGLHTELGTTQPAHRRTEAGLPQEEVGPKYRQGEATRESKAGSSRRKFDVVTSAHDLERLETK